MNQETLPQSSPLQIIFEMALVILLFAAATIGSAFWLRQRLPAPTKQIIHKPASQPVILAQSFVPLSVQPTLPTVLPTATAAPTPEPTLVLEPMPVVIEKLITETVVIVVTATPTDQPTAQPTQAPVIEPVIAPVVYVPPVQPVYVQPIVQAPAMQVPERVAIPLPTAPPDYQFAQSPGYLPEANLPADPNAPFGQVGPVEIVLLTH